MVSSRYLGQPDRKVRILSMNNLRRILEPIKAEAALMKELHIAQAVQATQSQTEERSTTEIAFSSMGMKFIRF